MKKACTSCGKSKDVSEFRKGQRRCKTCQNEAVKAYSKAHPEKGRERMRRYRAEHPEYVKRERKAAKAYNTKHKEKVLDYALKRQASGKTFINKFKDAPCTDCGNKFPPYVMDFDHVRGEKTANLAETGCYSLQSILEEIEKCDLVCANCHRIRTYKRQHS